MSNVKILDKEIREAARVVANRYNSEMPTTVIIINKKDELVVLDYLDYQEYIYKHDETKLLGSIDNFEFEGKKKLTIKDAEKRIQDMLKNF